MGAVGIIFRDFARSEFRSISLKSGVTRASRDQPAAFHKQSRTPIPSDWVRLHLLFGYATQGKRKQQRGQGSPDLLLAMTSQSGYSAFTALGRCLTTHDGGLNLLLQKAAALEAIKDKLRSESVKLAVTDMMQVMHAMEESNRKVIEAYNETRGILKKEEQGKLSAVSNKQATKTVTVDMETQSPCCWIFSPRGSLTGKSRH